MKTNKFLLAIPLIMAFMILLPKPRTHAAIPIMQIIKEATKKVIKAYDLMVQRMQNKTIWLQNTQKVLENKLSELKLTEIADWTEKHRELYRQYYDELWKVKTILAAYQRIRQIIDKQERIVKEYKRAWSNVTADNHFTEQEIDFMYRVYKGILNDSIRNLDQLLQVVNSFNTQMSDAQRLTIITQTGDRIEKNFIDLLEFNMHTYQLSLSRSRSHYEINRIRKLYGF